MNGRAQLVAVSGLVLLAVSCVVAIIVLAINHVAIPSEITALGGACGGALAAYITPFKNGKGT